MNDFTIKDSGEREEFASGMVRDVQEGKTLWRLVRSGPMLRRWAEHLTAGAKKYARDNWMLAAGVEEEERFKDSAARHFEQWLAGERDEDHAAGVFFNMNGAEYVRDRRFNEPSGKYSIDELERSIDGGSLDSTEETPDAGSTPAPSTEPWEETWGGAPVELDARVGVDEVRVNQRPPQIVTVGKGGTTYEDLPVATLPRPGKLPVEVIDVTQEERFRETRTGESHDGSGV